MAGIGGEKCDECALGFIHKMAISPDHPVNNRFIPSGQTPNCQPCGECFDNWNRTLAGQREHNEILGLITVLVQSCKPTPRRECERQRR